MQTFLLFFQSLVAVALVIVILIQRSAQDGGGLMGGGSTMGGLFTARGSSNLLTRTTAVLATIFILNSLFLGYLASSQHQTHSVIDQIAPIAPMVAPVSDENKDKPDTIKDEAAKPHAVPQVPVAQ